jgi:hypothetical protein
LSATRWRLADDRKSAASDLGFAAPSPIAGHLPKHWNARAFGLEQGDAVL